MSRATDEREQLLRQQGARAPKLLDLARRLGTVDTFEAAELEHRLSANPPTDEVTRLLHDSAVSRAKNDALREEQAALAQRVNASRAYRALRAENPFAAARFAAENPGSYDPEPNDGGPEAA